MAAQDEGKVRFDDLPLRQLKDWLEDWIDIPVQSIIGGTTLVSPGNGGSVGVSGVDPHEAIELRRRVYQPSFWFPEPNGGTAWPTANTTIRVWRWKSPMSATLAGLMVLPLTITGGCAGGVGHTFAHFGLYNDRLTTLKAYTGIVDVAQGDGIHDRTRIMFVDFITPTTVVRDAVYAFAVLHRGKGGMGCNSNHQGFGINTSSAADVHQRQKIYDDGVEGTYGLNSLGSKLYVSQAFDFTSSAPGIDELPDDLFTFALNDSNGSVNEQGSANWLGVKPD